MVVDKDDKGKWTNAEKTGWLKNTHHDANTKGKRSSVVQSTALCGLHETKS
jgi:hypothetical protein